MYFLITGALPFKGATKEETLSAITNNKVNYESKKWDEVNPEAKKLVQRLLDRNPLTRIKASEALEHPWIYKHFGSHFISRVPSLKRSSMLLKLLINYQETDSFLSTVLRLDLGFDLKLGLGLGLGLVGLAFGVYVKVMFLPNFFLNFFLGKVLKKSLRQIHDVFLNRRIAHIFVLLTVWVLFLPKNKSQIREHW